MADDGFPDEVGPTVLICRVPTFEKLAGAALIRTTPRKLGLITSPIYI